jgi:hypothetical protein
MSDVLSYIGGELRRVYQAVVRRPLPWRMIDALETLDDNVEADRSGKARSEPNGQGSAGPSTDPENPPEAKDEGKS